MDNKYLPRKVKVYLPLVVLFAFLVYIMPRTSKFPYDYRRGEPWAYETLTARFDFPIMKSDQELAQERSRLNEEKLPCYVIDENVAFQSKEMIAQMDLGNKSESKSAIINALDQIYARGVLPSVGVQRDDQDGSQIYIQKGRELYKTDISEVYTVDAATAVLVDALAQSLPLQGVIQPNLIFDSSFTDKIHSKKLDDISTTKGVGRTGLHIVTKGAVVTEEIVQLLDSYKAEYNATVAYDGNPVFLWLGNIIISLVLVVLLFLAIYFSNYKVFGQYNKYIFLLTVFVLPALATTLVARLGEDTYYMLPYTLVALYLYSFFKPRIVFSVYVVSLIPVMLLVSNGFELFIMHLVSGAVCMVVFERFSKGWLQFVSAMIAFCVMTIIWFSFRMIDGMGALHDYTVIFNMALSALLLVAAYPLVYLFEKIFGLVSISKLVELSDTSNKLLRQLADKAPGTFQHSLQVMSLADAAARSIDADVPLIRAGALYHDIGKIANPHCFTENATTEVNYHAELTPQESAHEIIKHVSDGVALAEKYGLPHIIQEFILTHHGTTKTGYFYTKYLNDGGDPADVGVFTYDGNKPQTKEQVILMLCDAVEAASRSLKGYSSESISALVDRIFEDKTADGQFSESKISLRELGVVKQAMKAYMEQMYHSRVAYPKRRK